MIGSKARVGEPAPAFSLACVSALEPRPRHVQLRDYTGRWLILVFYPRDFSFVCPTELTAFSARMADFRQRDCELLGISVDSIDLHQEWLTTTPDDGGIGPLQFPLASDGDGRAARSYGVWVADKEVSARGLFIVDPEGVLQYSVVHNLSVGRSPDEVLRVLDALNTGGLCPVSWTSADGTIDPERALQPGRVLGHYRIRGKLGGGTFGTVFAAWDLRLERMVALKVLKRNVFESRDAVLNEARAAAKLNHPHVCTIYAVDEIDGLPVIVMEHLDGHPLTQDMEDGLPPDRAAKLASQIAEGLAAAHEQNVVHGDLKPANVIVTERGSAKILDFGLARSQQVATSPAGEKRADPPPSGPPIAWEASSEDETMVMDTDAASMVAEENGASKPAADATFIRGTPAYMSPEQASGLRTAPASDVFSLGLILFEMLSGCRAHDEESPFAMMLKVRTTDMAAELAPQVGEAYRELLATMLARGAADRPGASKVADRLAAT